MTCVSVWEEDSARSASRRQRCSSLRLEASVAENGVKACRGALVSSAAERNWREPSRSAESTCRDAALTCGSHKWIFFPSGMSLLWSFTNCKLKLVRMLRYLRGWVFKSNGDQGKRRRTSDAWSVGDEGGPVAVQNPLLHTLHHGQEAVQSALSHSSQVQPTRQRIISSVVLYNHHATTRITAFL